MPEGSNNFDGGDTPKSEQTDQFSDSPTVPTPALATHGPSRRDFLKAAVIGSAAVAAAGSAGAAALSLASKKPGAAVHLNVSTQTGDPCSMCVEDTRFNPTSTFQITKGCESAPGSWFLWITDHSLPPGTYSLSVTVEADSLGAHDPGSASAAFQYEGSGAVVAYQPATALDCPKDNPANQVAQGNTLSDVFPLALAAGNLQVKLHLKYKFGCLAGGKGATQTFKFTAVLTNAQNQVVCTETQTITGHQQ